MSNWKNDDHILTGVSGEVPGCPYKAGQDAVGGACAASALESMPPWSQAPASAVEMSGEEPLPSPMEGWWTHKEVQRYLRKESRFIRKRMEATPDHIYKPFVRERGGKRPEYQWQPKHLDQWWREVNEWMVQQEQQALASDLENRRRKAKGGGAEKPKRRRSRPQKTTKDSDGGGGTLVELAHRLGDNDKTSKGG